MKFKIPFIRPSFPPSEEIAEDYEKIIQANWFTNFGPFEEKLRLEIAGTFPADAFVATIANATLGLQAALDVLVKPKGERNEVIIPSFTFAAGPEVILKAGLQPKFIDIDTKTWQPLFKQAEEYISTNRDKVAGILLCNTFGVGNEQVKEWEEMAKSFNLPLIIDSAAGFGSSYSDNEKIGLRGDCEVFSMHATKPFAVGEGGLVISRQEKLIQQIRAYQNFGFDQEKNIELIGTNAKLQELNCAIGLRQLKHFEDRLKGRQKSLRFYMDQLGSYGFETMPNSELSSVCFAPLLTPKDYNPEDLVVALKSSGIEARRYYYPLHLQKNIIKNGGVAGNLDNTNTIYSRIITLPVYDDMQQKDLEYITNSIKDYMSRKSASKS